MSFASRFGVMAATLLAVATAIRCSAPDADPSAQVSPAVPDAHSADAMAPDVASPPDAALDDGVDDGAAPDVAPLPKTKVRVLFIGNSYTSVNALPSVLAKLTESAESAISVTWAAHTPGGARWEDHDKDSLVEPLIQNGWDFVVLQDQSQQPWMWPGGGVKPALISLDAKIAPTGAKTVLFMTWARHEAATTDPSRFELDMAVNQYYERHAAGIGALVAPIGRAWERALRDPAVTLHAADGSHPNERGTYLAACVLYTTLTDQSPIGLGSGGLAISLAEQTRLQTVAWETHLARRRLPSPAVGAWPLSTEAMLQDFAPQKELSLGDTAGPGGAAQAATQLGPGKYAAIPYFTGLNVPKITVLVYAHRSDWSVSPAAVYEHWISKAWAYRLSQDQLTLRATLYTDGVSPPDLTYPIADLSPGWHQFAMTYDGSKFMLWVDASAVASAPATGDIRYYAAAPDDARYHAVAIGTNSVDTALNGGEPTAFFSGALSGLRIFDQALSSAELLGPP